MKSDRLERMVSAVPFLKTDRVGVWRSDDAGLLQFAFATPPQSVNEAQPALDERAGTVIVFDGRLDKREDLLRELRVRALSQDSPDSQISRRVRPPRDRLPSPHGRGLCVAIWQRRIRRLFCARSPLGWRPLVWYRSASVFASTTEIKALIDGLRVARRPNEGALAGLARLWREGVMQAPGPLPARLRGHMAVGALPLISPQRRAQAELPNLEFSFSPPAWITPGWASSYGTRFTICVSRSS